MVTYKAFMDLAQETIIETISRSYIYHYCIYAQSSQHNSSQNNALPLVMPHYFASISRKNSQIYFHEMSR